MTDKEFIFIFFVTCHIKVSTGTEQHQLDAYCLSL
jgi:hypothetical protein